MGFHSDCNWIKPTNLLWSGISFQQGIVYLKQRNGKWSDNIQKASPNPVLLSSNVFQTVVYFSLAVMSYIRCVCVSVSVCVTADADGEEAEWSAPSAHSVWDHRGELAGKPHPEGVSQGVLPHPAGDALPGRWTGERWITFTLTFRAFSRRLQWGCS